MALTSLGSKAHSSFENGMIATIDALRYTMHPSQIIKLRQPWKKGQSGIRLMNSF
jgi:hypothetical protein